MNSMTRFVACAIAATTAVLLPAATPATADHNSCSGHVAGAVETGTVSFTNENDWWTHTPTIPVTTYTLNVFGGDADLYIMGPGDCTTFRCSSFNDGEVSERCQV